jgi:invasion protein IalB
MKTKLFTLLSFILFLFSGLAYGQSANGQVFEDWVTVCKPLPDGSERCRLEQNLTTKDTNQLVLRIILGYLGTNKELVLGANVPLGVDIPFGVVAKIDENPEFRLKMLQCIPDGCEAGQAIPDILASQLKAGSVIRIAYRKTNEKNPQVIPGSLKGVTRGLETLAK